MGKNVLVIPAEEIKRQEKAVKGKLRVAAYCRVSTDEERQLGSFENQIEYFTRLIDDNVRYDFVKVYSDEGISGTSIRSRRGFCSMIDDCEAGLIDLVITKSISRFARNTQDSLYYTRKLKDMGIGVCFEKEGINTLESSGELLLTLFSCFAQEESRSISENTSWGIRSKFKQGIPHLNAEIVLGYDKDEQGSLVINEEQAAVVRRIYRMYLEGYSLGRIAGTLNEQGVPGVHGKAKWCSNTISRMLSNEKYKGAMLMQKTLTANYLTKQHIRNTGQLTQYYIEDDHPAIIEPWVWEAVQEEISRRKVFREKHEMKGLSGAGKSAFYSRLFCRKCDTRMQMVYSRGVRHPYWECRECGCRIEDSDLRRLFCRAFNNIVENGNEYLHRWNDRIRRGTPLERIRAEQMRDITAEGAIPFEIPELTQAVLQEIWLGMDNDLEITFLSGDVIRVENI